MKKKKGKNWIQSAIGMLIGLAFALAVGAVFYGVMAYQMAEEPRQEAKASIPSDALLALPGAQLISEQISEQEMGGAICTVTVRQYRTDSGLDVEAVSASPAAYIERLAREKWTAQPVTGFLLAGQEAICSVRGGERMLTCRSGERIYMLRAGADDEMLYTLGAEARLE